MKYYKFLLILGIVFLAGCASIYNTQRFTAKLSETYVVIPFENFTETPMAGLRASSLTEFVLASKGFRIVDRFWEQQDRDLTPAEIKKLLPAARGAAKYAVTGNVNEWRYKTGIDGEPVVSIGIRIYDTASGELVWSSVGARSGGSYESIGTVAQRIINDLLR